MQTSSTAKKTRIKVEKQREKVGIQRHICSTLKFVAFKISTGLKLVAFFNFAAFSILRKKNGCKKGDVLMFVAKFMM